MELQTFGMARFRYGAVFVESGCRSETCGERHRYLGVVGGSGWLLLLPTPGEHGPCPVEATGLEQRPGNISAQEVRDQLLHVHEQRGMSWKSCNCVRREIRFLFRITLDRPDPHFCVPVPGAR